MSIVIVALLFSTAAVPPDSGPGAPSPRLRNPERWRFLEPHATLIFTSDAQLRAAAADPEKPVKGLRLHAPDQEVSLAQIVREAADGGCTHITISFDFFFGGNARTLHPTHPDFVEALCAIAEVARRAGIGIGASVLNPLDFGRDFRERFGAGGEQHGFTEGPLAADGAFDIRIPIERVWANNKGPIDLVFRRARAFAFREDPVPNTPYLAVRPESIAEIPDVQVEHIPSPDPRRAGAYRRTRGRARGRIADPAGRNRVLVVAIH
ncbi:MAG: hypothetical protein JXP34_11640, partial [Planctomycetes bacterium]|nr:hypothetical protein [Planctomycetota bacterium]